jgi:hypothetical protein
MDLKIKECFEHINVHWKPEYYVSCIGEWRYVQSYMNGTYKCIGCGTLWQNKKFINDTICCNCDTHCQPYLSNPINAISVVKYLDMKYYQYIFPIYAIFNSLEDPRDVSKYSDMIPNDIMIAFKEETEYGISITILDKGIEYIKLFIDANISSFTCKEIGLKEKIYSNRTEYYINGEYYGNTQDSTIESLQRQINDQIMNGEIYPKLKKFIESDQKLCLFLQEEFEESLNLCVIQCNKCNSIKVPPENLCDFCDESYCDKCIPDDIAFHKCDLCGIQWCYINSTNYDDYCHKNLRKGVCIECGN